VSTLEFYLIRAEQCAKDAEETGLDNVRDRNLRARDAWLLMADKLERTNESRAEAAALKAEMATRVEIASFETSEQVSM
jgi:hypothetical protein